MLSLTVKSPRDDGFLAAGEYTLAIVPRQNDGRLNFNDAEREYTFKPNPTDIDTSFEIPNTIQPDQGAGHYIEYSRPGTGMINIRGTTGQYPSRSNLTRVLGDSVGQAASAMSNMLGITEKPNGYTEFMDLKNFFNFWYSIIELNPSGYAMLWVNHKDAEFYEVVPTSTRFGRTAARPLQYGYAISVAVVSEYNPTGRFVERLSWVDRMERIRGEISRWQQSINQAALISSYLVGSLMADRGAFGASSVRGVTNFLSNFQSGIQGLSTTANTIVSSGAATKDRFLEVTRNLFAARENEGEVNSVLGKTPAASLASVNGANIVVPTPGNVESIWSSAGMDDALGSAVEIVSGIYIDSETIGFNTRGLEFDQYAAMLDLELMRYLSVELAPIPDRTPIESSELVSRTIHEAARAGAGGYLEGREDELTSAALSRESYILDGVRTPRSANAQKQEELTLSYLASQVMIPWARSNDVRVSRELDSFRRGFLGMRNPKLISPFYRIVNVSDSDTIYSLASKYLGSWERWFEIVLINDLRYPYISNNGGLYCKSKGDSIYIPEQGAKVPVSLVEDLLRITRVHDRVKLEDAFLGFDIEIGIDGDAVFNKNDYSFVVGEKAFAQEVAFVLEGYGGITVDPDAGPGFRIGSKSKGAESLSLWAGVFRQWLTSDPRVAEVQSIKVSQNQDAVYFWCRLKFEGYDSSVVLADSIRL